MIWLAFRQFRTQAASAFGLLVVVAIALALTGPHVAHLYDTSVRTCASKNDCPSVMISFYKLDGLLRHLSTLVNIIPALVGIFWGAPLIAREMETGTYRMAWTQSVTRSRWMGLKLGVVGLASIVTVGLFSLMVTWWSSPFDRIQSSPFNNFDIRDIAPLGYGAFAFAIGVFAGVLIRKTLPAMAVTLVAFTGVRVAFTSWVRSRFQSPLHTSTAFSANGPFVSASSHTRGDWVLSESTLNAYGKVIGHNGGIGPNGSLSFSPVKGLIDRVSLNGVGLCPNKFPLDGGSRSRTANTAMQEAVQKCVNTFHLRELLTYQPASRYWTFQWYETLIFFGLALLVAGLSLWWVRRRVS